MMQTTVDTGELKMLLNEAITEVLQERRDLLYDALEEAIEDMALTRAIEEGASGENVSRDDIFRVLDGAA